jgi:regulator of protease activity HflC (stomatin/prohibitin superfamily)
MAAAINPLVDTRYGVLAQTAQMGLEGAGALPVAQRAPSARTAALARRVEAAKSERLNFGEHLLKGLGALSTVFTLGLSGFTTVPPRTTIAVFRFGKLDRVLRRPGLVWLAPFGELVTGFSGSQTHKIEGLDVIDKVGNPIVVSALLEYSVEDPAALRIAANGDMHVLYYQAEQVVRETCARLPLLGEHGADIRSQTHELAAAMVAELQPDASVMGVTVQRLCIVEARYAREIAAQMLMKQQAVATVAARREMVAGALGIIADTLTQLPPVSEATRDRIITSLLITLTGHAPVAPVLSVADS